MLSGSTATIKGAGTPVSMADHSRNTTIISHLKPSDLPPTTILVVSTDHNNGPKNAQNPKQAS